MSTSDAAQPALPSPAADWRQRQRQITTAVLVAGLPVAFLLALALGAVELPLRDVLAALGPSDSIQTESGIQTPSGTQVQSGIQTQPGTEVQSGIQVQPGIQTQSGTRNQSQTELIVNAIRLPRALLAALIGAVLALCGAASQGLFRNPLADPSLIGVTAGASAGASLMIVAGGSLLAGAWGMWLVSLGAFAGGVLTVWLVYRLATGPSGTSVASMLLAGIAITALAGSFTSLLSYSVSNDLLRRISLWQMGGLDGADHSRVGLAFAIAILVLTLIPRHSRALNALLLGESEARHLGFDIPTVQRTLIILIAAGVGGSVALAGTISFVGLVVPHIIRLAVGPDHRTLLPLSALAGAILLLLADTLARSLIAPAELPVGLVTALVGAPFFISLLRHNKGVGTQTY